MLLITFVGALGEETGWRGYALPQLQRRFSPLASSLILALLWFGWHLHGLYNFVSGTQAATGVLARGGQHPGHDPGRGPDRS